MTTPDDGSTGSGSGSGGSSTTIKIRFIFSSGSPDFSREYPVETTIKQVREELSTRESESAFVLEKDRPRVISGGRIMGDEETIGSVYVSDILSISRSPLRVELMIRCHPDLRSTMNENTSFW
jgi:hypothetical protein